MEKVFFIKSTLPVFVSLGVVAFGFFMLRSHGYATKGIPKREIRPGGENDMNLSSSAFDHSMVIPIKYTCDGQNINPPLTISNVPDDAQSLAIIMHDPDAPVTGGWTHWMLFNMDPLTEKIDENSVPVGAIEGMTNFGAPGYGGPCPPINGPHHYEFTLFALDSKLSLESDATKADLDKAMTGHILRQTTLIGLYRRMNSASK